MSLTPSSAAAVEPSGQCTKHPERPLIGTCSRCGAFVCIVCAPEFATHPEDPCEPCAQLLKVKNAPRGRRNAINASGAGGVLFGMFMFALFVSRSVPVGLLFGIVPAALGLLIVLTGAKPLVIALAVAQGVLWLIFFGLVLPAWHIPLLLGVFPLFSIKVATGDEGAAQEAPTDGAASDG